MNLAQKWDGLPRKRKGYVFIGLAIATIFATILGTVIPDIEKSEGSTSVPQSGTVFATCDAYKSVDPLISGANYTYEGVLCDSCTEFNENIFLTGCDSICSAFEIVPALAQINPVESTCEFSSGEVDNGPTFECPVGFYKTVTENGCVADSIEDFLTMHKSCYLLDEDATLEECFEACESIGPECGGVIVSDDGNFCFAYDIDIEGICNEKVPESVNCKKIRPHLFCFDGPIAGDSIEEACNAVDINYVPARLPDPDVLGVGLEELGYGCSLTLAGQSGIGCHFDNGFDTESCVAVTSEGDLIGVSCSDERGFCCTEPTPGPTTSPTASPTFGLFFIPDCVDEMSYEEAEQCCASNGATLAAIHNPVEQAFAWEICEEELLKKDNDCGCWNGLNRIGEPISLDPNDFLWSDGSVNDFNNFETYPEVQPNNLGGRNEECVHMRPFTNGGWNDLPCSGFCDAEDTKPFPLCRRLTESPTTSPTFSPTTSPSRAPSKSPTISPSSSPTSNPTRSPSESPTHNPTNSPTKSPTVSPSKSPTESPSRAPTNSPSKFPTDSPTRNPSASPTVHPTDSPTRNPSASPTRSPTQHPTSSPTTSPTVHPTHSPSKSPSESPTRSPSSSPTSHPTESPTKNPSQSPTDSPTQSPSTSPTKNPTKSPSITPTTSPTKYPSVSPSNSPTDAPTKSPTVSPTKNPTQTPTETPSVSPTKSPTKSPTRSPSTTPTASPTESPTNAPTRSPTKNPTHSPTQSPSDAPTSNPTESPTGSPSRSPTENPTSRPSESPTSFPTKNPSVSPTRAPSTHPTQTPTTAPSGSPTPAPSNAPTRSPFKFEKPSPICFYDNNQYLWELSNNNGIYDLDFIFLFNNPNAPGPLEGSPNSYPFCYFPFCQSFPFHLEPADSVFFSVPTATFQYSINCPDNPKKQCVFLANAPNDLPACDCELTEYFEDNFNAYPISTFVADDNTEFSDTWVINEGSVSSFGFLKASDGSIILDVFTGEGIIASGFAENPCLDGSTCIAISGNVTFEPQDISTGIRDVPIPPSDAFFSRICTMNFFARGNGRCGGEILLGALVNIDLAGCLSVFPGELIPTSDIFTVALIENDIVLKSIDFTGLEWNSPYSPFGITADVSDISTEVHGGFAVESFATLDSTLVGPFFENVNLVCCCPLPEDKFLGRVVEANQGPTAEGEDVPAFKSDPLVVLNKEPGYTPLGKTVYSLGLEGSIIFEFSLGASEYVYIYEESFTCCGHYDPEDVVVSVSVDGVNWQVVKENIVDWVVLPGGDGSIRYTVVYLPNGACYKYLKLVDNSDADCEAADGFDLVSVIVKNPCCPTEYPPIGTESPDGSTSAPAIVVFATAPAALAMYGIAGIGAIALAALTALSARKERGQRLALEHDAKPKPTDTESGIVAKATEEALIDDNGELLESL